MYAENPDQYVVWFVLPTYVFVCICMYVSNACVHENDFRRKTNSYHPITQMEALGLSSSYLCGNYYTYVYMYVHVYVYNIHTVSLYVCTYVHTCVCVSVCTYVCVHVFVNILIQYNIK